MKPAYKKSSGLEEFTAAREQFEHVVNGLQSEDMRHKEHGEVEAWIHTEGTEVLRRLLQGHLDLRASREVKRHSVTGSDGIERSQVRAGCERGLMSLFGEVTVRRYGYGNPGHESLFPLDRELNLPQDKYSLGMRERVAVESSGGSFDEAVVTIVETTGGKVPKRQAEQLAVAASRDFDVFYEQRAVAAEETSDLLAMSVDGKGIVMRQEDLRDATRKAAADEQHKLRTRLSRGEKRHRKRMATVATVYTQQAFERSAESIMGLEETQVVPLRPKARDKRVWASVEKDPKGVIDDALAEALRRDPKQKRDWIMLVDGQPQQLNLIRGAVEHAGVEVTLVLDFIHVLEYVWKAAYCFHAEGSEAAEEWVAERALWILQGKGSHVAAGMRRSATLQRLSRDKRKAVDLCANYLLKYRDLLHYDEYLERGLPIATGVIEGACRHLIKDRLDITGARWRLQGAEAILRLRSLKSSGDLDEYWKFHNERLMERNYATKYEHAACQEAA